MGGDEEGPGPGANSVSERRRRPRFRMAFEPSKTSRAGPCWSRDLRSARSGIEKISRRFYAHSPDAVRGRVWPGALVQKLTHPRHGAPPRATLSRPEVPAGGGAGNLGKTPFSGGRFTKLIDAQGHRRTSKGQILESGFPSPSSSDRLCWRQVPRLRKAAGGGDGAAHPASSPARRMGGQPGRPTEEVLGNPTKGIQKGLRTGKGGRQKERCSPIAWSSAARRGPSKEAAKKGGHDVDSSLSAHGPHRCPQGANLMCSPFWAYLEPVSRTGSAN